MNLKKNDNNYARVYCRFDQLLHTYKDKKKKIIKCTNTEIGGLDEKYATTYFNTFMNYSSIPSTKH